MAEIVENPIIIPTNKYQTDIDKKLKDSLPDDVWINLLDFVDSVEFVKKCIAPDRPYVADMPKDENGYVLVDIANPHILENMEFFIQDRLHFDQHGYYNASKKSFDPNSAYRIYWDEQKRRSLEGYENEETGEWISGYNYFYWNFGRIYLTVEHAEREEAKKKTSSRPGRRRASRANSRRKNVKRADRIESFPDIWEIDYYFFHYIEQAEENGEYAALLKCRGMGASFKGAGFFNRNYYLIKGSKSFAFAYSDGYLTDDGILTKTWDMEGFIQKHTAFKKNKLVSSIMHRKSGYFNKDIDAEDGFLSEISGVNTKNPDSGRGKRGKIVIHEEAGSHKHQTKVWSITDKSLDDKGNVFGLQLGMGTGGDENSDFIGLTRLYFTPRGYNVHAIPNVFDKGTKDNYAGFFMGEYMNRPNSYNSDGITDIVKNLVTIFEHRHILEQEIDDPNVLEQKKAEGAITPLESIVTMEESVFPKTAIKAKLAVMAADMINLTKFHKHGWVIRKGETGHFELDKQRKPINEYPYLGKQANRAAAQIFNVPATHSDGSIPWLRYIIGVDVIEEDEGVGSLFSFHVMDLWRDVIVATYTGRSVMTDDDYDLLLATALWYNASIMYENNLKGLYGFFKNKRALKFLAPTPQIIIDKGYQKTTGYTGNKSLGIRTTKGTNSWGRQLQASWLRRENDGLDTEDYMTGLDTVQDMGYLRELSMYAPVGNYDRISAGNMLFIYREELTKITESTKFSNLATEEDYNSDEFFNDMLSGIETIGGFGVESDDDLTDF